VEGGGLSSSAAADTPTPTVVVVVVVVGGAERDGDPDPRGKCPDSRWQRVDEAWMNCSVGEATGPVVS
ncbi:hypothetical protein CRUP_011431, partial [Coryphaenoides rupestris]